MFEISWSELLILGIVVLVFVGPKELPVFMRTIGKYAGVVRRHANDFKTQFDAAMREAELESMRQEVDKMQASINAEVMRAGSSIEDVARSAAPDAPGSRAAVMADSGLRANDITAPDGLVSDELASDRLAPPMPSPPGKER